MATGNRKTSPPASGAPAGGKAAPAPTVNWAGVKKAFTSTHDSNRAIGKKFRVSHTMVAKRAAADGWQRPPKDERGKATAPRPIKAAEARQDRFVAEYLVDLNGTQAYLRAVPGTPERTAQTMANRLLKRVEVQAAIAAGRQRTADRLGLTREKVMAEYARLAFFDMRSAYHPNGALKMPHEMDMETASAIVGYETVELPGAGKEALPLLARKVKWGDRKAALDSIMKAQGWNKSDVGTPENPLVLFLSQVQGSALPVVPDGHGAGE